MGNCQTVDAAALVIQHPNGKQERMYSTVTASEVMKLNPGHYVSLIIPSPITGGEETTDEKTVRYTSVKLLRPTDTLVLGRAYRLVTTQEVMKVLKAKKCAKMKKKLSESTASLKMDFLNLQSSGKSEPEQNDQTSAKFRIHEFGSRKVQIMAAIPPKHFRVGKQYWIELDSTINKFSAYFLS